MTLSFIPPQASKFAEDYDLLFWTMTAVICVGGGVVYAMLTYFCFRYSRKSDNEQTPRIHGSTKLEFIWTIIPLITFVSFCIWGLRLFNDATDIPPDAPEIFVVGKQWMWKIQHQDGVREINELHLEINKPVKITVVSEDVIHNFGIPAFRSKIDAVPNRYVSTWYQPTMTGEFHIFCDQYCGQGHSQMVGKVYVLNEKDYADWKEGTYRRAGKQNSVDGSAAWEGEKLFKKLQCITCHNGESGQRAPNLFGLYGQKVPLADGKTVTADTDYFRESIRRPLAKVHEGWRPIMPAYPPSQLTESELLAVIAYLKSKKAGDPYPARVDDSPNQTGAPVDETPRPVPAPVPGPKK